jgi:hypothetical protein
MGKITPPAGTQAMKTRHQHHTKQFKVPPPAVPVYRSRCQHQKSAKTGSSTAWPG